MMDEALIDEVAQHGVIFNRQKYYLNGSASGGSVKYETKDEAWQIIAMKLRTDVETCKKRWKYLRERYVSQRKQGDPPVYEHLSRPYLEKMKFLDQHIQPRKSYRNVPNFLTSPHSANSSNYSEYNMDSKSNGSMKGNIGHYVNSTPHHYQQDQPHSMSALSSAAAAASAMEGGSLVKIEADQVFREFAAAVASQQLQHISQSQMQHHTGPIGNDTGQSYQEQYREHNTDINNIVHTSSHTNNDNNGDCGIAITGVPSSSSSMKSPLSSPLPSVNGTDNSAVHNSNSHHSQAVNVSNQLHSHSFSEQNNQNMETETVSSLNMKKPRVQLNSTTNQMHSSINPQFVDDTDDDSDDNSHGLLQPQTILNEPQENNYNTGASTSAAVQRNNSSSTSNGQQSQQNSITSNTDFLYQLYQQLPHQQQSSTQQNFNKFNSPQNQLTQRTSEQLLGELVTTELLKMTKERRKNVQKRILEILFFDD